MNRHELALTRCDRCGAAAKKQVLLKDPEHELLFCDHHYNQHQEALVALSGVVILHLEEEKANV